MNYYTLDLLRRFGSEDDDVADAAQAEYDEQSERYVKHLESIAAKLPARFREVQDRFYLHDARVLHWSFAWPSRRDKAPDRPPWAWGPFAPPFFYRNGASSSSMVLVLHLDTPPHEQLVLQYRDVTVEAVEGEPPHPYFDKQAFLWLYDEIALAPGEDGVAFAHAILFSNGFELRLRFRDFDFATLKPAAALVPALPAAGTP
jgi:hypothetical protein